MRKYVNRAGDIYWFQQLVGDNRFEIKFYEEKSYIRYGGKEGQASPDVTDLQFIDFPDGPFIELGMSIEGKIVKKIQYFHDNRKIIELG